MKALQLIAMERERQRRGEGYSLRHDDDHCNDELARAAAVYAMPDDLRNEGMYPNCWTFKPSPDDRIRELVKAGALIVAEIERLQRAGGGA